MIPRKLAIALVVFSTLAPAGGGLARADDLRYSVRPVGQARMVQLRRCPECGGRGEAICPGCHGLGRDIDLGPFTGGG